MSCPELLIQLGKLLAILSRHTGMDGSIEKGFTFHPSDDRKCSECQPGACLSDFAQWWWQAVAAGLCARQMLHTMAESEPFAQPGRQGLLWRGV